MGVGDSRNTMENMGEDEKTLVSGNPSSLSERDDNDTSSPDSSIHSAASAEELKAARELEDKEKHEARVTANVIALLKKNIEAKRKSAAFNTTADTTSQTRTNDSATIQQHSTVLLRNSQNHQDPETLISAFDLDESTAILENLEKQAAERKKEYEAYLNKVRLRDEEINKLTDHSFAYKDEIFDYQIEDKEKISSSTEAFLAKPINFVKEDELKKINNLTNETSLNHYYIAYQNDGTLHTINLYTFLCHFVYDDMEKTFKENQKMGKNNSTPVNSMASIYSSFTDEHYARITAKMKEFGIKKYGFITNKQKNQLLPPFIVSNAYAIAFSLVSVSMLSFNPYTAVLSNLVSITALVYNAHPKLATLFYQRNQRGQTPSIKQKKVLARDTNVLTAQALTASLTSTIILDVDFHSLLNWVDTPVSMVAATWFAVMPWYVHLAASITIGLILGSILTGIAYASQRENNEYSSKQLAKVFAIGFIAGALMYPAYLMSCAIPGCSQYLNIACQFLINLGMMAGLSVNIGDRLSANKARAGDSAPRGTLFQYDQLNAKKESDSPELPSLDLSPSALTAAGYGVDFRQ